MSLYEYAAEKFARTLEHFDESDDPPQQQLLEVWADYLGRLNNPELGYVPPDIRWQFDHIAALLEDEDRVRALSDDECENAMRSIRKLGALLDRRWQIEHGE